MIELVDMSAIQSPATVDFNAMKASGIRGVYFKASQYSQDVDHSFSVGIDRASAAGLIVGAYHFAYCGSDPVAQMSHFFNSCKGVGAYAGQLPPMLDWEYAVNGNDGKPLTPESTVVWLEQALEEMQRLWYTDSLRKPTVYTFPYFAQARQPYLGLSKIVGNYPLTLAAYPNLVVPPAPWHTITVHQYAGNGGRVPGVAVPCDRDRFIGSEDDFQRFIGNVQ